MEDGHFKETCFICGKVYSYGPHRYDGKWVKTYQMNVCMTCYDGNWDGWNGLVQDKITAHLERNGIKIPEVNEKGLLPQG